VFGIFPKLDESLAGHLREETAGFVEDLQLEEKKAVTAIRQ
jgi:hypothetical protein